MSSSDVVDMVLSAALASKQGETELISLRFKQGYVLGDTVEGVIGPDLDPGLALFFVWLVYVFRNEDAWMASAPPALS